MSVSRKSLLSRLYAAAAREHWSHGDYYSYSVYFCTTIRQNTNRIFGAALVLGPSSRLTCSQDICIRSAVRSSDTLTGSLACYKFVTSLVICQTVKWASLSCGQLDDVCIVSRAYVVLWIATF